MMTASRIVAIVIISMLLLVSCANKTISGEVVDKEYKEEWIQIIPVIHNINGVPVTQTIPIVHEEGYYLIVKPDHLVGEDDEKNKYVSVGEEEYDQIEVGDKYESEDE